MKTMISDQIIFQNSDHLQDTILCLIFLKQF